MTLTSPNEAIVGIEDQAKSPFLSKLVGGAREHFRTSAALIGLWSMVAVGPVYGDTKGIQTADASNVVTPVSVTDAQPSNTISLFEESETPTMPSRDFLYTFFPDISQDVIDAFYDAWESLPETHKMNVENLFVNSLPSAQKAMILNFENARTGELKLDQRNLASLAMLISQINDLVVFNETGVFPASGQLPDALAQLKRTQGVSTVFGDIFSGDFEVQVKQIQDTVYAKYDAIIAEENAKQAEGLSLITEENAKQAEGLSLIAEENAKQAQLRQANETLGLLLKI